MNKLIKVVIAVFIVLVLMFAEYRFIMHNIRPYLGNNNTVYLEFYGMIDEYYADYANYGVG